MKALKIGMVSGMMILAISAFALPAMMKEFQTTYKLGKDSKLKKLDCVVCHTAKGKTKLNVYGEDVKKAMADAKSKTLTADILKKVEDLDSDKDGSKNIDEIKADTEPGNAKSKPAEKSK